MRSARFVGQRWKRAQVGYQCREVFGGEAARGIVDHLAHGFGDDVAVRSVAGLQEILEFPIVPLLEPRRCQIWDPFAIGSFSSGEEPIPLRSAKEIARRVAFAAMARAWTRYAPRLICWESCELLA